MYKLSTRKRKCESACRSIRTCFLLYVKRYMAKKGAHLHLSAKTGLDSLNIVPHSSKVLFIT